MDEGTVVRTGIVVHEDATISLGKVVKKETSREVVIGEQNKEWEKVVTDVGTERPTVNPVMIVPAPPGETLDKVPWTRQLVSFKDQSEVLLLGRTRVGKSVMTNQMLSTDHVEQGDCIKPCTQGFQVIRSAAASKGEGIDFVDSEGCDETNGTRFLPMLAGYLNVERRSVDSKLRAVAIVVRQKEQFGTGTCYDQLRACVQGFWGVVVVVTASTRWPGNPGRRPDPEYDNWLHQLEEFFRAPIVRVNLKEDDYTPEIVGHAELAEALIAAVERGRELEKIRQGQVREVLAREIETHGVRDLCVAEGERNAHRLGALIVQHKRWQRNLDEEDAKRLWIEFIQYTLDAFLIDGRERPTDGLSCSAWLFEKVRSLFDQLVKYSDRRIWLLIPVVGWRWATGDAQMNTEKVMRTFSVEWAKMMHHLCIKKLEDEGPLVTLKASELCSFVQELGKEGA